jgi:hypothetical protein
MSDRRPPQPERAARRTGEKGTIAAPPYCNKGVKFAAQLVTYCNDAKLASKYMGGSVLNGYKSYNIPEGYEGLSLLAPPRGPSGLTPRKLTYT